MIEMVYRNLDLAVPSFHAYISQGNRFKVNFHGMPHDYHETVNKGQ
jgi:hypothetical protein